MSARTPRGTREGGILPGSFERDKKEVSVQHVALDLAFFAFHDIGRTTSRYCCSCIRDGLRLLVGATLLCVDHTWRVSQASSLRPFDGRGLFALEVL